MYSAYLDIETTGLSPEHAAITVVGIYLEHQGQGTIIQLVGEDISDVHLIETLARANTIYTYNGSRFDLPFIHRRVGVNLLQSHRHHDLMYDCWKCNLYGGLKSVERQIGITRHLQGIDGYMAVQLWWRYHNDGDKEALNTLLKYNREDIMNLKLLKERLLAVR
jgi:uncharacterized protein YprB with RNaseH-like and TPR domain